VKLAGMYSQRVLPWCSGVLAPKSNAYPGSKLDLACAQSFNLPKLHIEPPHQLLKVGAQAGQILTRRRRLLRPA